MDVCLILYFSILQFQTNIDKWSEKCCFFGNTVGTVGDQAIAHHPETSSNFPLPPPGTLYLANI